MGLSRRLQLALYVLIFIVSSGIIGYIAIERWSFVDALYMTIMTITTVGYGEVHPLSRGGEIFSVFLIRSFLNGLQKERERSLVIVFLK